MAGYWPAAGDNTSLPDYEREYSGIWRSKQKVVFSRTLESVEWNSRLVKSDAAEEVVRLKEQGDGLMTVGGPTLAGSLIAAGLVDEFWVYLVPATLGGGKPMFGPQAAGLELDLVEMRKFASGGTLLHYRRRPQAAGEKQ